MKTRIILFTALSLCCACTTETTGETGVFVNSYIDGFCKIWDIDVDNLRNCAVYETDRILSPYWYGDDDAPDYRGIAWELHLRGERIADYSELYPALCSEIGDTSFDRRLNMLVKIQRPDALTETIDGIRIRVNEDYSASYPAGADVSALFILFYEYPYAVVKNHYQSPPDTYRLEHTSPELPQAIYKINLAQADLKGKKALGCTHYLLLNGAPDREGNYTFTVEVTKADGKILTVTTKPIPIRTEQ